MLRSVDVPRARGSTSLWRGRGGSRRRHGGEAEALRAKEATSRAFVAVIAVTLKVVSCAATKGRVKLTVERGGVHGEVKRRL